MSGDDLSNFSMEELFRAEAEGQCNSLSGDLLALEKAGDPASLLESLMRAAHSLKGAARIVGMDPAVTVAHAMEDCFVRAQKKNATPDAESIDVFLRGVDLLRQISGLVEGMPGQDAIAEFASACKTLPRFRNSDAAVASPTTSVPAQTPLHVAEPETSPVERRNVRLDSERLDSLLGLAGQAVVASQSDDRDLAAVRASLRQLQAMLAETTRVTDPVRHASLLQQAVSTASHAQSLLVETMEQREGRTRRMARLCHRIYNETLSCRMRPFGDLTPGLHRMARDLARSLGKEMRVEIEGEDTEVDRDLLDRLDGPLSHFIRNAADHGIEFPAEREALGKPREGRLRISARHHAGWLVIGVADDGRGLDDKTIREAIVRRGLSSQDQVGSLTEAELMEFLLLPGFSIKHQVTEISGRGVGLDAARAMAYGFGGSLRMVRQEKGGLLCEIILPVSLSLVRSLIVEIGGDYYGLPLTRVDRVVNLPREEIHAAGGRQHFFIGEERIEVLSASQVLELESESAPRDVSSVVVLQGPQGKIGLAFDRFVAQKELSLQRLDARLGRWQDVSATALLDDGSPVVVLDINDLAISAANFSSGARYRPLAGDQKSSGRAVRRILVADDSLTVRELERKLLASRGYSVETAVDGADAWNALRGGAYDLLVTDIDMPRLDGIELVRFVRGDARLRDLPVIVVSYKDRDEDRARGLEAGADFYLPKASYQDESLLNAVRELIGEAVSP